MKILPLLLVLISLSFASALYAQTPPTWGGQIMAHTKKTDYDFTHKNSVDCPKHAKTFQLCLFNDGKKHKQSRCDAHGNRCNPD